MAKWKLWKLVVLIISLFLVPLILTLVITRFMLDPVASWWWFLGLFIGEIVIGSIVGVIFLVIKLLKKKEPDLKIKPEDARGLAIYNIVADKFNPENFIPSTSGVITNEGDPSKPRTPVYHISGFGKVFEQRIDVFIDMNNSTKKKLQMSELRNATSEEIEKTRRSMAEFPIEETTEKITTSADMYGRPQVTTEKKYVTKVEQEQQKEKEQADMEGAF